MNAASPRLHRRQANTVPVELDQAESAQLPVIQWDENNEIEKEEASPKTTGFCINTL